MLLLGAPVSRQETHPRLGNKAAYPSSFLLTDDSTIKERMVRRLKEEGIGAWLSEAVQEIAAGSQTRRALDAHRVIPKARARRLWLVQRVQSNITQFIHANTRTPQRKEPKAKPS